MTDPRDPPAIDRWDALVQPERGRVHRTLYTDPAIFDLEMERIWGGTWTFLCHDTEIPNPHDYVLKRMGRRSVIMSRDRDGRLHALLNRCPHRGAQVCRDDGGNRKVHTCGYHAWSFGSDGACVGLALPRGYGDDRAELMQARALGRVPFVDAYRGFVFGTFNPDLPPLVEHLADARELIDYWLDRQFNAGRLRLRASAQRYVNHCNWKAVYDNAGDGYHPAFSHRSMLEMTGDRFGPGKDMSYFFGDIDQTGMLSRTLGNGHTAIDQRPGMYAPGRSSWREQRPQPGSEAAEAALVAALGAEEAQRQLDDSMGAGINLNVFPNLLLIGNQVQVIEPVSAEETHIVWYATVLEGAPGPLNTMRLRSQEDFPIFGEPDDTANWESCQLGMHVPEMEWLDISRHMDKDESHRDARGRISHPVSSDVHMRAYYAEWKRLMRGPRA